MFTANYFIEFLAPFNFIEVMDNSKVLCIGFDSHVKFYNIEEDPLNPKLISSFDTRGTSVLKLDENLVLIDNNGSSSHH